jgi:hypothetical protein
MKRALALLALIAALAGPARAEERLRLVEQEIKAAMIYNFLKYTDWPAASSGPAIVCLIGANPLGGRLAPMAGRTVNQRVIEVRAMGPDADTAPCALVFLDAEQKALWPKLKSALSGRTLLTVSDFDGFAASGGMIEFTRVENRIGVAINTAAVAGAHLSVEERLLALATIVPGGAR